MRILIVEDEIRIAENIKKYLVSQGFVVELAHSKEHADDLLSAENYDAIILDWMLGDGSGLDLCTELRKNENHTPIIILTAKSSLDDKLMGLDSGADDYLVKPFAMEELHARLKALIRRVSTDTGTPILHAGELELNTNTCEVKVRGKKIELAPKEYSLLEYLMMNPCKVVTREEIMSHVWGEELDPFSNTVDVHIRYLRMKMEGKAKKGLIKTVKNKGYMLCAD